MGNNLIRMEGLIVVIEHESAHFLMEHLRCDEVFVCICSITIYTAKVSDPGFLFDGFVFSGAVVDDFFHDRCGLSLLLNVVNCRHRIASQS